MNSEAAIAMLVDKFPNLLDRVDSPLDAFIASPYLAYGLFAQEVIDNRSDRTFMDRVCAFIDQLAESGDKLLEEVLVLSVLERVAEDGSLARELKGKLGVKAQKLIERVESEYFGRTN
jgi:hypothetical protein